MLQYSQMPSRGWSRTIRSFRFSMLQVYAVRVLLPEQSRPGIQYGSYDRPDDLCHHRFVFPVSHCVASSCESLSPGWDDGRGVVLLIISSLGKQVEARWV